MSKYASIAPRCWWKMRDFLSVRSGSVGALGSFVLPLVHRTLQVTSSSVQQGLFFRVSTFNHLSLSLSYATPCHILALVTLANGSARAQQEKNCPSIQLIIHEVRHVWTLVVMARELDDGSAGHSHASCSVHPKRTDSSQHPTSHCGLP